LVLSSCVTSSDDTVVQEIHRVCATATTVRGVDVSVYQGTIDWPAAAAGGVDFTIIRQSHGTTDDTTFTRNWAGAHAAGIIRGAYQYFNPWSDPTAQANNIVDGLIAGGFGVGDLPPTLDVEQPAVTGMALPTPANYTTSIATWVAVVRRRLGVEPIIYTGGYYWDGSVRSSTFASLPLWHAQYFNYPATIYNLNVNPLPNGACATSVSNAWTAWTFWQFAGGNGRAPGFTGAVDLDVFNGTMAQLRALTVQAPVMDAGTDASPPRDSAVTDVVVDVATTDVAALDAGATDASPVGPDGFTSDGARRNDASADGSTGTTPPGCGCRTARGPGNDAWRVLVMFAAGVAVRRRRRRR
ncbi:MAG: GH25 family lysozyme, partial [Deltaproteobacteria bacterium]